jgi:hypothetical protein
MIIHDLDLLRSLTAPPEHDPPLIVYSDRMLAREVPSQSFQSVAGRRHKITKQCGVVQLHQFSAGDLGNVRRKALWNASLLENQRRDRAPEARSAVGRLSVQSHLPEANSSVEWIAPAHDSARLSAVA